jgi:hypothetical protein
MWFTALFITLTILASSAAPAQAAPIGAIIQGTPVWVYLLIALLLYLGIQATRPRTVSLVRAFITPAIFIAWGLVSLFARPTLSPVLILDWLLTAGAFGTLAFLTTRLAEVRFDHVRHAVSLPASWLPLARNLLIFAAKYGLAIAAATHPAARDQLALWDIAVSGASAGYFLGWLARFTSAYRQTPTPALSR